MALGTDDGQTTRSLYFVRELDVGTTTGHVGGDGHGSETVGALTCQSHDVGLFLMKFGIEDLMGDAAHLQHLGEKLGDFNGSSTYKARTSAFTHGDNLIDDGIIFLACGLVNTVIQVFTLYRAIGRNLNNVEFIDVPELTCFGRSCTRHT